ncbi:hypothetical protein F1880_008149 [Penicillium rolfsii]|nr:hypothetical protein F1880_008149 [Penicillium rolfsii]
MVDGDLPCGSALLGGLAEEEAELLEALGEDVFARHGEWQSGRRREDQEVVDEAEGYHEAGRGRRCIIQLIPNGGDSPSKETLPLVLFGV